jgi:acyl-CoA thioesterase
MDAVNGGLENSLFVYMQNKIKDCPIYQLLGIEAQLLSPGYAEIRVAANEKHTNPIGLIHGGITFTIADSAMGNAIRGLGINAVTVDFSASFIAAAKCGDVIVAKGKVLKAGKSLFFAEAYVYGGDNLIGHCKGTFYKISDLKL